jgi:uncharacterized membrane protein
MAIFPDENELRQKLAAERAGFLTGYDIRTNKPNYGLSPDQYNRFMSRVQNYAPQYANMFGAQAPGQSAPQPVTPMQNTAPAPAAQPQPVSTAQQTLMDTWAAHRTPQQSAPQAPAAPQNPTLNLMNPVAGNVSGMGQKDETIDNPMNGQK